MSAYIYTCLNAEPPLSDAEYDRLSVYCAEKWSELEPLRQFMLGSAHEISYTGSHVKVTWAAVFGAHAWVKDPVYPRQCPLTNWQFHPEHHVHWSTLS